MKKGAVRPARNTEQFRRLPVKVYRDKMKGGWVGDGVSAGQFIGGMYCEAFFEDDILKVIDAGLACIPADSQYAEMVRDVVSRMIARKSRST